MKAWRLNGTGVAALKLESGPMPEPGHGEVLVRIHAASINHRDLAILGGAYPIRLGVIPFSDGAGTVEKTGAGVMGFAAGDQVIGCFYPYWESGPADAANHRASLGCEIDGMLGEYVVIPASGLVRGPATLTSAEAATLPCAGLTAWTALFTEGRLEAGQTVLIQGTGGVAVFALQLATMAGARVILLSGDDAKIARAQSMGADIAINYRRYPDWAQMVLDATNGEGADLILELGGQDTLPQSLACVRVGGRISIVGVLSGLVSSIPVPQILFRHVHLTGVTVGNRAGLEALCRAIDQNGIKPVIDTRFAFADAPAAYDALFAGRHFGKLVVELEN